MFFSQKITNKIESIKLIKSLDLNRFPEQLFYKNQIEEIKAFLNKYLAKYYAIRDKSRANGIFKLKVPYDNVLEEIEEYNIFTINVSSANYANNQILVGEIEILSNGEVYALLSINPTYSVRDVIKNPTFNLKTDIFDKMLNNVPEFNFLYEYIVDNHLKDVIVEFSLFDKDVGLKKDKIIIYELRTDY